MIVTDFISQQLSVYDDKVDDERDYITTPERPPRQFPSHTSSPPPPTLTTLDPLNFVFNFRSSRSGTG